MNNAPFNKKLLDEICSGKKPKHKKRKKSAYCNPYFDRMNNVLIGEDERRKKKLKV